MEGIFMHPGVYIYLLITCLIFSLVKCPGVTAEIQSGVDESSFFSCKGRSSGYYADVQSGCQKYHMCDASGRLYSYECPNRTLFQQRVMICDHWFMVDCSLSENYFSSNLRLGTRGKPFLEGNEPAYHLTPNRASFDSSKTTPYRRSGGSTVGYPRSQDASSTQRRHEASTPRSTTANPWGRKPTPSKTPEINNPIVPKVNNQTKYQYSYEKVSNQTNARKVQDDGKYVRDYYVAGRKDAGSANLAVKIVRDGEGTTQKVFANNPLFSNFTTRTTEAPLLITTKGQSNLLTTRIPFTKDQRNVFDKNPESNITSTPLPSTTKPPLSVTPPPRREVVGHLRDSPTTELSRGEDLGVGRIEDLLSNTVEVRIPDTRHMFYIADNPTREAEMLNTNNETVLTISLPPSFARHHGAMRFKGLRNSKGRRDDCPQCHPAFLLPGKCQPCVLIR